MTVHNPKNVKVIEKLYVILSVDKDGLEGIMAKKVGDTWMPMVSSDSSMIERVFPSCVDDSKGTNKTVKIVSFTRDK